MHETHTPARTGSLRRVSIVQEYIPEYRVPFFRALTSALLMDDIHLAVVAGLPPSEMAARGDATAAENARSRTRSLRVGRRTLTLRSISSAERSADLVIAEQAIRHLDTYVLGMMQRVGGPRLALWGHGRSYATCPSPAEARLKRYLTGRSHWFFSYTEGGVRDVIEAGVSADRITVVQNSTDTRDLGQRRQLVRPERVAVIRSSLGLQDARVCLAIGALDGSKRLDFLLEAGALLSGSVPGSRSLWSVTGRCDQNSTPLPPESHGSAW